MDVRLLAPVVSRLRVSVSGASPRMSPGYTGLRQRGVSPYVSRLRVSVSGASPRMSPGYTGLRQGGVSPYVSRLRVSRQGSVSGASPVVSVASAGLSPATDRQLESVSLSCRDW